MPNKYHKSNSKETAKVKGVPYSHNKPQDQKREIAEHLAKRGLPGDLKAEQAMGFDLEGSERKGWRLKA